MNKDESNEETKWNRSQPLEQSEQLNEGFSSENLSANYNPAQMKTETEVDDNGNLRVVDRARHSNLQDEETPAETGKNTTGNEKIENHAENRDRNYDVTPNRYPPSHQENHENRGNIELDND